jgi:predicted transcriptional regulator of viral defense system
MWQRLVRVLCTLCVLGTGAVSVGSCGYSLAGRGTFLPDYIKAIGVPTFTNRTTVFNLETQLTQKVRSEFIGRGKYRIVPDENGVDAVLIGEVTSVAVTPTSFNTQQLASRYTITMSARVELRDLKENKVLWENPGLIFRDEYDAQGGTAGAIDPAAFFGADQTALDRMSTEFARTIVSAILEAF